MAHELTVREETGLVQWRKPSLPDGLKGLVDAGQSFDRLPVLDADAALALQNFVDHPEPPLATESWMEEQILALSIKAQRTRSSVEARLLVEIYLPIMAEHTKVDLGYAIGRLMRESKWFPDISEIVKYANFAKSMREYKKLNAQMLIYKHKKEWKEPFNLDNVCTEEDRLKIKAEVAAEYDVKGKSMFQ